MKPASSPKNKTRNGNDLIADIKEMPAHRATVLDGWHIVKLANPLEMKINPAANAAIFGGIKNVVQVGVKNYGKESDYCVLYKEPGHKLPFMQIASHDQDEGMKAAIKKILNEEVVRIRERPIKAVRFSDGESISAAASRA
jgi:hypothetical protein